MERARVNIGWRGIAVLGVVIGSFAWAVPPASATAPAITSFSPTAGTVATAVTVTGSGFTGATAVKFNGITASFTINSDTQITTSVPVGATTGKVAVVTPGGTATSSTNFLVIPKITSFSPPAGATGTFVTINGSSFTGATSVKLNGVAFSTFTVVSDVKITATTAAANTTGAISVTTLGGTGTSATSFTVIPGMTVAPVRGWTRPGGKVTATLSSFGAYEAVDVFWDLVDEQLVVTSGVGQASSSFNVPLSAVPGQHWVTAIGRRSGFAVQKSYNVYTDWTQPGMTANRQNTNRFENVIDASNAGTLESDWSATLSGTPTGPPVAVGNFLYQATLDGAVHKINGDTGAIVWSRLGVTTSGFSSPPAVDPDSGILAIADGAGTIFGVRTSDGGTAWTVPTSASPNWSISPAFLDGVFYMASFDGVVRAISANNGALAWSFSTGRTIYSGVAITANGRIMVRSCTTNPAKEYLTVLSVTGSFLSDASLAPYDNCSIYPTTVMWGQGYWVTQDNSSTCMIVAIGGSSTTGAVHSVARLGGTGDPCGVTGYTNPTFAMFENGHVAVQNDVPNYTTTSVWNFFGVPAPVTGTVLIPNPAAPVVANHLLFARGVVANETTQLGKFSGGDNFGCWNAPIVVNGGVFCSGLSPDQNHFIMQRWTPTRAPLPPARPTISSLHPNRRLQATT